MSSRAFCASLLPGLEVVEDCRMAEHIATKLHEIVADRPALSIVCSGGKIAPRVLETFICKYLGGRQLNVIATDERITTDFGDTNAQSLQEAIALGGGTDTVNLIAPAQDVDVARSANDFMKQVRDCPTVEAAIFGVGNDGHVASHFPGVPPQTQGFVDVVIGAPSPFTQRITLSMAFLGTIPHRLVALAGVEKAEVLRALASGMSLPVAQVKPTQSFVSKDAVQSFSVERH
ncbi:MAG: hypothetical protein EBV42_00570 [Actinobacteria bacterium]|nr:hypothetical protein [Actinomycetota bacterium]